MNSKKGVSLSSLFFFLLNFFYTFLMPNHRWKIVLKWRKEKKYNSMKTQKYNTFDKKCWKIEKKNLLVKNTKFLNYSKLISFE